MDFAEEMPLPHERNLMRIAAREHFQLRLLNWNDVVSVLIGMLKLGQPEDLGSFLAGSPYWATTVSDLMGSAPAVVQRYRQLWQSAPAIGGVATRLSFPITWKLEDGTRLNFTCVISVWNDYDAAWANDWHPADGATWAGLKAED